MKYRVTIGASKTGSIGTKYLIKRTYEIEHDRSEGQSALYKKAINRAYQDGDIEHVRVEIVADA